MARRTFFSFHYVPDVQRAMNVRNSWVTQDREEAGFFDGSVFESKKRTSDDALKRFLAEGLVSTSVTAVLYTAETAQRRWVRYELLKSFIEGKGILSIAIHSIKNLDGNVATPGPNPLESLAYRVTDGVVSLHENVGGINWTPAKDVSSVSASTLPYAIKEGDWKTFGTLFSAHDWSANGRENLATWIETAATRAGR